MAKDWIAALLNFILWGAGYLYTGKKRNFAVVWLIAYVLAHLPVYYLGFEFYFTQIAGVLILSSHILISMLLAYDVSSD